MSFEFVGNRVIPICIDLTSEEEEEEEDDNHDRKPASIVPPHEHSSDVSEGKSEDDENDDDEDIIDLTLSDNDDEEVATISFKCAPAPARKRKRHPLKNYTTNVYTQAIANKEKQEREDEALARSLQEQEETCYRASYQQQQQKQPSPTLSNLFRVNGTPLSFLSECTSDYEIVARVIKELEGTLEKLGWKKRIPLAVKAKKLPIPQSTKDDIQRLVQWRNKIIHDDEADQLSDLGTSREEFLDIYSRVLQVMASFPSDSVLRPLVGTSRFQNKSKRRREQHSK